MLAGKALLHTQQLSMELKRRFTFQITYPHRQTILGWHTEPSVDRIRHRVPFDQRYPSLTTQLAQNLANALSYLTK